MGSTEQAKTVEMQIEDTVIAINSIILEIRQELKAVTDLVNSNGELHSAVLKVVESLSQEAERLGIDTNTIEARETNFPRISTEPINAVEKLLDSLENQHA